MSSAIQVKEQWNLRISRLTCKEEIANVRCGVDEIDKWAKNKAHKFNSMGRASVFVAKRQEMRAAAVGWYALAHSSEERSKVLDAQDRDKWERAPIVFINYLAVSTPCQGAGAGMVILVDALHKSFQVHQVVPLYGVGLRSLSERTTKFYEKLGFRKAPGENSINPLMILPMWSIRDLFEQQ